MLGENGNQYKNLWFKETDLIIKVANRTLTKWECYSGIKMPSTKILAD